MRIDSSGNVGIGDSAPSEKLNVAGNVMLEGSDQFLYYTNVGTGNSGIYIRGRDSTSELRSHSTGIFTWEVTGAEKMRIDSSGFVGIGVTNPGDFKAGAENLVIGTGSGAEGMTIYSASNASGRICFADNDGASDEERGVIQYAHDDNHMQFNTDATERMRIDSSGRVLIGTTSSAIASTAYQLQVVRDGAANLVLGSSDTTQPSAGTSLGQIGFHSFAGSTWGIAARITGQTDGASGSGDNPGRLVFSTTPDGTDGPTERMRIDSSGIVKIDSGTNTNGILRLVSSGSGNANMRFQNTATGTGVSDGFYVGINSDEESFIWNYHDNFIAFGTNGDERMRIQSDGRIKATTSGLFIQTSNSGSGNTDGLALHVDGNTDAYLWNYENTSLRFATNNTERARFNNSGNLLIGHSSAADSNNRLEVENTFGGRIGLLRDDTSVASGNNIGQLSFYGNDSNGIYHTIGQIEVAADGTHSTGSKPTRMQFYTCPSSDNSNVERMRIDSEGGVYMGGSSDYGSGNYAQSSGNGNFYFRNDDGSTGGSVILATDSDNGWSNMYLNRFDWGTGDDSRFIHFFKNGNGISAIELNAAGTQIAYNTGSDYRLKENVVSVTNAISRLKQLQPKSFNYIADEDDNPIDGFLAHEASTVVPYAVTGTHNQTKVDEEGNTVPVMQGMDYGKLTPLLTAALQEAIAKIETLETKVAALEAE